MGMFCRNLDDDLDLDPTGLQRTGAEPGEGGRGAGSDPDQLCRPADGRRLHHLLWLLYLPLIRIFTPRTGSFFLP